MHEEQNRAWIFVAGRRCCTTVGYYIVPSYISPRNGVNQRTAHFTNWLEVNSERNTWILDESEGVSLEKLSLALRAQTQLQYRQGEPEE